MSKIKKFKDEISKSKYFGVSSQHINYWKIRCIVNQLSQFNQLYFVAVTISDIGIKYLTDALKYNRTIHTLLLSGFSITHNGSYYISEMVKINIYF